jgi:hypothetical protein
MKNYLCLLLFTVALASSAQDIVYKADALVDPKVRNGS